MFGLVGSISSMVSRLSEQARRGNAPGPSEAGKCGFPRGLMTGDAYVTCAVLVWCATSPMVG